MEGFKQEGSRTHYHAISTKWILVVFFRYGNEGCNYLYEIDAHINDMSRLIEGQVRHVIDATIYGNVSRFINHR